MASRDALIKMLIVGDAEVGKSCLLQRYADEDFNQAYVATIGIDFTVKTASVDGGKECKLQIWDASGQERFIAIGRSYYRGAQAILIACDLTNEDSIKNIPKWKTEIDKFGDSRCDVLFVGTKCDKSVDVRNLQKLREIAEVYGGIPVLQCSARNNTGVAEVFQTAASRVLQRIGAPPSKPKSGTNDDDDNEGENSDKTKSRAGRLGGWSKK